MSLHAVDNESDPTWIATYEAVVGAATMRKERGLPMDMPAILDHAGVDANAWNYALRCARVDRHDELEAFYRDVLGRKLRRVSGVSRKTVELVEETEDPETADTGDEGDEGEDPTPGNVMAQLLDWFSGFSQDERTRILKSVATFYEIDVIVLGADDAPPKLITKAGVRLGRKPGPKPKGRRGWRKGARA